MASLDHTLESEMESTRREVVAVVAVAVVVAVVVVMVIPWKLTTLRMKLWWTRRA